MEVGNRRGSITSSVILQLEEEAAEARRQEEETARSRWLILPSSNFHHFWLGIIGPLIVYNVIWVPLEVSRMVEASVLHAQVRTKRAHLLQQDPSLVLSRVSNLRRRAQADFILDFFFYIDMVINLRTAFVDKDNGICLDAKKIAKRCTPSAQLNAHAAVAPSLSNGVAADAHGHT